MRLGELRDGRRGERRESQAAHLLARCRALRARSGAGARGRARRLGSWRARARERSRSGGRAACRTSSVASSAQCRSSSTRTVGARLASSRIERRGDVVGLGAARPRASAKLAAGELGDVEQRPSGRGVNSASQAPQRNRAGLRGVAQKRRRSAVFPTPASPATRTSRPLGRRAVVRDGGAFETRESSPRVLSPSQVLVERAARAARGGPEPHRDARRPARGRRLTQWVTGLPRLSRASLGEAPATSLEVERHVRREAVTLDVLHDRRPRARGRARGVLRGRRRTPTARA